MNVLRLLIAAVAAFAPSLAVAQTFGTPEVAVTKGAQLGKMLTSSYQIGMIVTTQGGPSTGIYATAPVPIDWPEQKVRIVKEEFSPAVRKIEYRMVAGTVKQMLATMPLIAPADEAKALVTVEVERYSLLPPADVDIFKLPNDKKLTRELRHYLQPSPKIESNHYRIKEEARKLMKEHAEDSAWRKVEALYDWTREKVQYVNGPLKGAAKALQDGTGDCEELSSLFIALCRASNIPARTVWVPDHCYPEFYLEDADGVGYWFPCQAAGTREFGGITEHRPILQKGDNFMVPEKRGEQMRYVSEYLTGLGGNPKVRFIRQVLETAN